MGICLSKPVELVVEHIVEAIIEETISTTPSNCSEIAIVEDLLCQSSKLKGLHDIIDSLSDKLLFMDGKIEIMQVNIDTHIEKQKSIINTPISKKRKVHSYSSVNENEKVF